MLKRINKFKGISLFLIFCFLLSQSACGDSSGVSNAPPSPASNAANGAKASNRAAANTAATRSTPIGSGERTPTPQEAPVITGVENYPLDPGSLRPGSGFPESPDFAENPYAGSNPLPGSVPNMPPPPPYFPGAGGQDHSVSGSEKLNETEYKPATAVMYDLETAIDRWSEAEAAGYGLKMTLVALWRRKNPTVKYYPVGIDSLTSRIRERPAFVNCPRAQKLSRDMFHDDGIRTVGHLYDYLEPCGSGSN